MRYLSKIAIFIMAIFVSMAFAGSFAFSAPFYRSDKPQNIRRADSRIDVKLPIQALINILTPINEDGDGQTDADLPPPEGEEHGWSASEADPVPDETEFTDSASEAWPLPEDMEEFTDSASEAWPLPDEEEFTDSASEAWPQPNEDEYYDSASEAWPQPMQPVTPPTVTVIDDQDDDLTIPLPEIGSDDEVTVAELGEAFEILGGRNCSLTVNAGSGDFSLVIFMLMALAGMFSYRKVIAR